MKTTVKRAFAAHLVVHFVEIRNISDLGRYRYITSVSETNQDRNLAGVVQVSSALSLGTLAAVIYSVKSVTPEIRFAFSFATVIAFAAAVAGSIAFWHVVFQLSSYGSGPHQANRKRWFRVLAGLLGIALIIGFAYPLRGFSREKLSEIGVGSAIAAVFLSVLGILFWRVVRYLEKS